jgi:hypothetical protein
MVYFNFFKSAVVTGFRMGSISNIFSQVRYKCAGNFNSNFSLSFTYCPIETDKLKTAS